MAPRSNWSHRISASRHGEVVGGQAAASDRGRIVRGEQRPLSGAPEFVFTTWFEDEPGASDKIPYCRGHQHLIWPGDAAHAGTHVDGDTADISACEFEFPRMDPARTAIPRSRTERAIAWAQRTPRAGPSNVTRTHHRPCQIRGRETAPAGPGPVRDEPPVALPRTIAELSGPFRRNTTPAVRAG
jgi:hypothetical protein